MDILSPNASLEEIANEKVFYEVMLETLDQDSPDFVNQRDNNERIIAELDDLLQQRERPITPLDDIDPSELVSPNSLSLPSRSRNDAIPDWGANALLSPLHRPGPDTNTTGKRLRQSPTKDPRKYKRSRGSFSSGADTPASPSSDSLLAHGTVGGAGGGLLERLRREELAREERWKQEQADAEFARSLEASQNSNPGPSQSHTQGLLGTDGRIRSQPAFGATDPSPHAPSPFASLRAPGSSSLNADGTPYRADAQSVFKDLQRSRQIKQEADMRTTFGRPEPSDRYSAHRVNRHMKREASPSPELHPGYDQSQALYQPAWDFRGAYGTSQANGDPSTTFSNNSSESLQSITMDEFNASNPPAHSLSLQARQQNNPHTNSAAGYTYPWDVPGHFPQSFSSQAHPTFDQSVGGPSWKASFNQVLGGVRDAGRNLYSEAHHMLSGQDIPLPRTMGSVRDDIHERGLDYLLSDPGQTKEDLIKLLENIRPDEEIPEDMRGEAPPELSVQLMRHQQSGLEWLKRQEESDAKGGILADDMGLGKTVQALALILARRSEDPAVKTTLIVAPVALMRQWQREIEKKIASRHALKVLIYHTSNKKRLTWANISTYDVVLTTFGMLASEYKIRMEHDLYCKQYGTPARHMQSKLVLFDDRSKFWRIIIDEAQNIKNTRTQSAKAATLLQAEHRLAMTGTPMMNNILELYALVKFLRIPPYNIELRFKNDFVRRIGSRDERTKKSGMQAFQAFLKAILLRRLKTSKQDGMPILNLPARTTEITHTVFDDEQKEFYDALHKQSILKMNKYLKENTIGKNYTNALVLLLRLRQACCHPHLIKDHAIPVDGEIPQDDMENLAHQLTDGVVSMIKESNGAFECPICYDAAENPKIFFPCGHDTCAECFTRMINPTDGAELSEVKCPECRTSIDPKKIINYNVFMKVYMPGEYAAKFPEEAAQTTAGAEEAEDNDESDDSESEDGDDDESDDSQGDLDGFIVRDDDEIEYEGDASAEDERNIASIKNEDDEKTIASIKNEDDDTAMISAPNRHTKHQNKSKGSSSKLKGKGKGKSRAAASKKPPKKTLAQLKKEGMRNKKAKKAYIRRLRRDYVPSAKLTKTIDILTSIKMNDLCEKTIIFSQFTSLLDLIEIPINDHGWDYARYDGSMSASDRNDAVVNFANSPSTNIMLVSLKAGNAGLNLNCASQVIILDPFWNPFIEEQAVDRAHRIGQVRPVKVHRVLVAGTVEDRIIALQEKKRAMIDEALDEKVGQALSRLGRRELAYLFGISDST
ncbi:MAG: hypothetical protein M1828_006684 [Chrysothrix sp. TS-e1954]|nr:MAG: hypothetical protein M1828_006684 [Chrysothrix sp. TS-e1954]